MTATMHRPAPLRLSAQPRPVSTEDTAKREQMERFRNMIRDRLVQGDFRHAPKSDQYLADNVRDDRVQCVTHLTRLLRWCRTPERVGAAIIAGFGRRAPAVPLPVRHVRETEAQARLDVLQAKHLTGELQLPELVEMIDAAWDESEEARALAIDAEREYNERLHIKPLIPVSDDEGRMA